MIYLIVYSALIWSYIANQFLGLLFLEYMNGLLALLSIFISYCRAKRLYTALGNCFFSLGVLLFILFDKSLGELPLYFTSTILLLALFYVLPFINSIIVVGRYDQQINKLLKLRITNLGQLYFRSSLISFLFGSLLNLATLPFVHGAVSKTLKKSYSELKSRLISSSVLRGYALCSAWSPLDIIVAMSIDITKVGFLTYLPFLFSMSMIMIVIDWLFGRRYRKYRLEQPIGQAVKLSIRTYLQLTILFLFSFAFIFLIVIINHGLNISFLLAVILTIIPFSFMWALAIKRFKIFIFHSLTTWKKRIVSLQDFMVLFLGLGFFMSVLRETVVFQYLYVPFQYLSDYPVAIFLFIQFLFIAFALLGLHPIITISVLGEVMQPMFSQISPLSVGIVFIFSSLSTAMIGPYNVGISIMSQLSHVSPYRLTSWNLLFALCCGGLGVLVGTILL